MSEMDIDANLALDRYVTFFKYDGGYDSVNEALKWDFIEAAVDFLEKATGRDVAYELQP